MHKKATIDVSAMAKQLVNAVQPEQLILFGSYARGEATQDSDIDLLVVEKEPFSQRSRRKNLARIRLALSYFHIAKDILLFDVEEVEQWKALPNHVVAQALAEGKVLYARP